MNQFLSYTVRQIEAKASLLLNECYRSIISLPIDVDFLIENHSLVADFDYIPELENKYGIAGLVFRLKKDSYAIFIDARIADLNNYFYRFTVAEELSHVILHQDIINSTNSIEKAIEVKSNPNYKLMDRNAKRFAAAILMPSKLIIRDSEIIYNDLMSNNSFSNKEEILAELIIALRKIYDVSKETMFYRLNEWPIKIIDRVIFSFNSKSDQLLFSN